MSVRRQNVRQWRSGDQTMQTHEVWKLRPIHDIARTMLLAAADKIGGVPAPEGFLWVKVFELRPPDGWEPA